MLNNKTKKASISIRERPEDYNAKYSNLFKLAGTNLGSTQQRDWQKEGDMFEQFSLYNDRFIPILTYSTLTKSLD